MSSVGKRMSRSRATESATTSESTTVCDLLGMSGDGNDPVLWVMRVVLIVYAAFVASNLPGNVAKLFDNTVVRLVLVVLILALAVCDPASAILLTVGFVLSIQTANKMHISKLANVASTAEQPETFMARMIDNLPQNENENEYQLPAVDAGAGALPQDDVVSMKADAQQQQPLFTHAAQFSGAQTNVVQDNQQTEVRTWQNEMGPQGLSEPTGYAFTSASTCSLAPL